MNAATLRHRVALQARTSTRSGAGEETARWNTVTTFRARIRPLTGFERNRAQVAGAETEVEIFCRYHAAITVDKRIEHDGRHYAIHAVIDRDLAHREMQLLCTESLADG